MRYRDQIKEQDSQFKNCVGINSSVVLSDNPTSEDWRCRSFELDVPVTSNGVLG